MPAKAMLLRLSASDAEILEALATRLYATDSNVIRWSLRWYAAGGPWRHPDERELPPLRGRIENLDVGPQYPPREVS